MSETFKPNLEILLRTGIDGMDYVLGGGLFPNRSYLVEGDPGSGKTTFALQFLLAGRQRGERCMFVTLSESSEELRTSAATHGWSLDGIDLFEIIASEESLKPDARYTMYHPSEVELTQTTKAVLAEASRIKPTRIVFDSLSELRLLAENPLRYRRQILALKQYFSRQQCTVIFIDDLTGGESDTQLYSLAHGVIRLARTSPDYGIMRRRLQVLKYRGHVFREGYHDYQIRTGGMDVFPRLVAAEHHQEYPREPVKSALEPLDELLGGGLTRGTSTLILGAAGTGKSSVASQYVWAAAKRGENSMVFVFDESEATYLERSRGLGMDFSPYIKDGRIIVRQVDPAEMTSGEFTRHIRVAAEKNDMRVLIIDSLNGYLNAMPSEQYLILHLHELLTYLGQIGVSTLLIMTQYGIIGREAHVPLDASYLADAVILMRYFEVSGAIHQAISVIKKRTGKHERTIRELHFNNGLSIGEPLRNFQGVLTGTPEMIQDPMGISKER